MLGHNASPECSHWCLLHVLRCVRSAASKCSQVYFLSCLGISSVYSWPLSWCLVLLCASSACALPGRWGLLNHRTVCHIIDDIWPPGEPVLLAQINFCLLSGHVRNVQVTIHLPSIDILSVDLSSSKERGHDKHDISYCPTNVFLVGLRTVYTSWWCFGRCGYPLDVPTMPQTTLSP